MLPPSEKLKTQEAEPALETASEPATVLAADSVRVLIVDDHPMVREGLAGILERHRMQITGLAANGRQGIEMYFSQRPDVMLLDLRLPDQSVIRAVLKSDPAARIVVLSSAQGDASIHTAIALGVCGYLLKGIDGATLAQAQRPRTRSPRPHFQGQEQ
jgi:DNA-binding NarL/FixJ family response regulator